jgi:nitric oxide reductase NorE protein
MTATALPEVDTDRQGRQPKHVPAESGIWLFVFLDVLIFGWMFGVYAYQRAQHPVAFHSAAEAITPFFGLAYTLLLLTSSWFVVSAIAALKRREYAMAERLINWGFGFGAAFAVLKLVEYSVKFTHGHLPISNDFLMFYFVLTFIHLLHASAGLILLVFVRRQIRTAADATGLPSLQLVEAAGIFWHMVDLLWIFLFALFYLGS